MFGALALVVCALVGGTARAHNLDTRATSIHYANDFIEVMSQRAAANQRLVQTGDEFWVIIKTTPGPGTTTGVGGYQTFYVPPWMQIVDAGYMLADPADPRGVSEIPMKGQSPIAIGDGPVGAKSTPELIGFTLPGTNVLGLSHAPVTATGLHRGTIAGIYADTGIFYSTDPRTAFNSYGAALTGGVAPMINNSGDTVGEWEADNVDDPTVLGVMTLWDSYQLRAYGRKDVDPIIDYSDGRGNAPWGLANVVAGPQSGYAWEFDYDTYTSTTGTTAQKIQAAIKIGPWNRIRYPGGQLAFDQPELKSTVIGYAAVDASNIGYDLSPANPLPTDTKAVRFAIGQLELGRPELSAVKVKILSDPSTACFKMYGDAFGGDAGGTDGGKDHIWRYFDPTAVSLSPCSFLQKSISKSLVAPGETFYYTIAFANNGSIALPNITLTDTLPSGVNYVSATPPPTSSSSPVFTWELGTVQPQTMVVITNWVQAGKIGTHYNNVTLRKGTEIIDSANQSVMVAYRSQLQKEKTVTPSNVAAGATVDYTITINNNGTGANGTPLIVRDYLPTGFSYDSFVSATLNGASIDSPTISVNSSDPAFTTFTIRQSIQAGKKLVIKFRARAGVNVEPGTCFNGVELLYEGKRQPPIPEAPVTVGGVKIGNTVYRDWNGDGMQSSDEEGIAGLAVTLYAADGTTLLATTTTDANGYYDFSGLTAGTYVVKVNSGNTPAGYTQSADPDSIFDSAHTVTLAANEQFLTANFGYQPTGSSSIGDKVFEDIAKDGIFNTATDFGIPNVTVALYVDSNDNGVIDAGDALLATTQSDSSGDYLFSGLAAGYNYLVKVALADPDIQGYFNNKYDPDPVRYVLSTSAVFVVPNLSGDDLGNDFGFWRGVPSSIGDQVFVDANGDEIFNTGETPLAGVGIRLSRDGQVIASMKTKADGTYLFDNLEPGDYVVALADACTGMPAGYSPTVRQYVVTLPAGTANLALDFPFVPMITKSVDKSYAAAGTNLLFSVNIGQAGCQLLDNLHVFDPLPAGVTFSSATAGGVYGPYLSEPGTISENTVPAVGMAIYNNNNDTFRYRTWNSDDDFSAELSGAAMGTRIQMMAGASSPTTAERVISFMDSSRHVYAAIWNGTAWSAVPTPPANSAPGRMTSSALTANSHQFWGSAVAYEQNSGHLMLIWNDDANTAAGTDDELRFVTRENGTWGTASSIAVANQPQNLRLTSLPDSDKLALVFSTALESDYAMIWNGTTWGNIQELDTSGGSPTSVNIASETQSGRAMVVYGKAATTSPNLFYRVWNGTSWSIEKAIAPPAGVITQPKWVTIASDTYSNRIAVGVVTSGGRTWLAVWNGNSWVNVLQATPASLSTTAQNVAVAFEAVSGNLLAAYGADSAPAAQVRYRTWLWDAVTQTGAWSGELAGPTATSGNPNVIMLTSSPTTSRIMMALNTSANRANYVAWDGGLWDGTVFDGGNTQVPTQQPMIYLWNRDSIEQSSAASLVATPTTVAAGSPITVEHVLKSSKTITNVTSSLSVMGGSAVITTTETFPLTVYAGVTRTITYTVMPTSMGEIHFHATATGGAGYDFGNTDSNTLMVSPDGSTHTVTWNLGSSHPCAAGVTSASKYLYAFQGNNLQSFWAFNPTSGNWNNPLDPVDTPSGVTVREGGALTTDGTRYIYALRGDASRVFLRYDSTAETWDNAGITDLPATTAEVVDKGGALTYLDGNVYAFVGDGSSQFWRYSVAGNTWTQMADAPDDVDKGAGLTTDGTNLYATRGDKKKNFWRYNVAANTWTTLTPFADNISDGGGLVYFNGAIYVLRGDRKTTFRRYNIAANSWTTLTPAPATIDDGGAIASDGTYLYVLRGKSNGFYRYNPGTDSWTTLATTPATVGWGGALTFLAAGDVITTEASALPMLVGGTSQIVLRMTVTSEDAVNNITANIPTYTAVNGVTATFGSATLVSPDNNISGSGDPVIYEWLTTVTPGTVPGEITFSFNHSASDGTSALANSVLITPELTWTATVTDAPPDVIRNVAIANEDGESIIQSVPSNMTETYTSASIGNTVWLDANGDGLQDAGEQGVAGVEVKLYDSTGTTLLATTTTDAMGTYHFYGLTAGDFTVVLSDAGAAGDTFPSTPTVHSVTLGANEQYQAADFGLKPGQATSPALIGDTVWRDANEDGVFDVGEAGAAGVAVNLYLDANGDTILDPGDTLVQTVVTDANGNYSFEGLYPTNYLVNIDLTDKGFVLVSGTNPHAVTVTSGQSYLDADFGLKGTGSIGDQVFVDVDLNGVYNAGDTPIPVVTVWLYADDNGNGVIDAQDALLATTATAGNGTYTFGELGAGNYLVKVNETDANIPPNTTISSVNPRAVALAAGQSYTAADFPFVTTTGVVGEVALQKSVDLTTAAAGSQLTYTITPNYAGQNMLTDVLVTDYLPPNTTYVPGSANPPLSSGPDPLVWNLGSTPAAVDGVTDMLSNRISILPTLVVSGQTVTVSQTMQPISTGSVDTRIASSADDVEEVGPTGTALDPGTMYSNSSDLELVEDESYVSSTQTIGLRFNNITIPPGATITSAKLSFRAVSADSPNDNSSATSLTIKGQAHDNAPAFGTADYYLSNLITTTASASWTPGSWTTGTDYDSSSITAVVQEIVDRGGWVNGNDMAFVITGTGSRTAASYDGDSANAPRLQITWASAGATRMVTPTMAYTTTNGTIVTLLSGPTPAAAGVGASGVTFTWKYEVSAAALDEIVFVASGNDSYGAWPNATNSALVTPPLTFKVTVDAGATLDSIANQALISSVTPPSQITPAQCFAVADAGGGGGGNDRLVYIDGDTGLPVDVGDTGTYNIEAIAWDLARTTLYAIDKDTLGTLDLTSGAFTAVSASTIASASNPMSGSVGNITSIDADAMSFDPLSGNLYAAQRRSGLDLLFIIDPLTGQFAPDAFGAGIDYVTVKSTSLGVDDIDGISFQPQSGELYAVINEGGSMDYLTIIDKTDGSVTSIGSFTNAAGTAITDVEGLSFFEDGTLHVVTGQSSADSAHRNRLWEVDPASALTTEIVHFLVTPPGYTYSDYESVACRLAISSASVTNIPSTYSPEVTTYLSGNLGDFVWVDLNGDGQRDAGEPGLGGVTVFIDANNNGVLDTGERSEVTDGAGFYRFLNLTNSTYDVRVDLSTIPVGYGSTTPSSLMRTISAGNLQVNDADFGFHPPSDDPSAIAGNLWIDRNEDGVIDGIEAGITNVTVKLYHDVDNNGVITAADLLISEVVTAVDGSYTFPGLYANDYLVLVDTNTLPAVGLELVSGTTPADVTLGAGATVMDVNFGYNYTGSIGDTVWWDDNLDGEQDAGEDPIANAAVLLYVDANGNGMLDPNFGDYQIATATTDANGRYLFENLPPGAYLVDVYEDSITTGGIRDIVPTTGNVRYHELGAGEAFLDADFGYYQGAAVEGNVFWDYNRNTLFEPVELGLTNITVTLTGTDAGGNPVSLTTTTGTNGIFNFLLPEGDYTVTYSNATVLAGYPLLSDVTTPTSYSFYAHAGEEQITVLNFGVDNSGRIGDIIFADVNGNPGQQAGEAGLAEVTVQLYANPDNSDTLNGDETLLEVMVTDELGQYEFVGLADGNYLVQVVTNTLPAVYQTVPTTDPDAFKDSQGIATITGGNSVLSLDFGYPLIPLNYSVSGTIYDDNGTGTGTSGDGIQNGSEPGLAGVRVTIEVDADTNGVYEASYVVYTDVNGDYELLGIPEGSDVLLTVDQQTLPNAAYVQTGDPDNGALSNLWTIEDLQTNTNDLDFGYLTQYASISGTVVDGDGNGIADLSDSPMANVTVTLLYAGIDGIFGTADDVVDTTATEINGVYNFTDLVPGNYRITKTAPAEYVSLADADGGNPNSIDVLSLLPGQDATGRDFEVTLPDRYLGDRVWRDLNGDGMQDDGEPGVAGVTIHLYAAGPDGILGTQDDTLEYTQVTDGNGEYLFEGLAPESYLVKLDEGSLPAGYADYQTHDLDGLSTPHQTVVTLDASEGRLDADFGYYPRGAIGNFVWEDLNGDGLQDAGEPGLTNVTVHLYNSTSNLIATTVTDAAGQYAFTNLLPGAYYVQAEAPEGYTNTLVQAGEDVAIDSDMTAGGWSSEVTVISGQNNNDIDFGLYIPAQLFGYLFEDENGDQIRNTGDTTITNALVQLIADGQLIASTLTDTNGWYKFSDVPAGVVTLQVVQTEADLVTVPASTNVMRNRATSPVADTAIIEYNVTSGYGVLSTNPGEPLNFGYDTHPLSTRIDLKIYVDNDGSVKIQIATVNENGSNDIEIYAMINGGWTLVAMVPSELIEGIGSHSYTVEAFGLTPGSSYMFKIFDESGHVFYTRTPIEVARSQLRALATSLTPKYFTMKFNTEPYANYALVVSSSLAADAEWAVEEFVQVVHPAFLGGVSGPSQKIQGTPEGITTLQVPRNRAKAFYKLVKID